MARKQKYIQKKQSKEELKVDNSTVKQKILQMKIRCEECNLKMN